MDSITVSVTLRESFESTMCTINTTERLKKVILFSIQVIFLLVTIRNDGFSFIVGSLSDS